DGQLVASNVNRSRPARPQRPEPTPIHLTPRVSRAGVSSRKSWRPLPTERPSPPAALLSARKASDLNGLQELGSPPEAETEFPVFASRPSSTKARKAATLPNASRIGVGSTNENAGRVPIRPG